jgi:hypothetical protein
MKYLKFAILVSLAIVMVACATPELNFANRDGASQLALMDNDAPPAAADELKASPFEMAAETKSWENRDGLYSLKDIVYSEPQNITFLNGNPGTTQLGLCRFIDKQEDGTYNGYELMDLRWDDAVRFVKLDPGHYAVTQYREMPGQSVLQKIKGFQEFDVTNEPFVVEFFNKKLPLPNNVM